MNIAVCMKQVPDTTAKKELTADFRLNRGALESVLNPFDEYAIEEALRQKEAHGGEVTLVCMGPAAAEETMRKGLAMGADKGILITDDALKGSDISVTARVLAAALGPAAFDLILCGQESADARTGLLPGSLAEHLNLPLLSYIQKLEVRGSEAHAQREVTGGYQNLTTTLPAVVMVVKAINEPRYPSLKGIMASKRKEITRLTVIDFGLDGGDTGASGSRTVVSDAIPRPQKEPGTVINEPATDAARLIADFLFEKKVVA
ncbi:MAG TPA: electron transfer flavoprotein subunit beta/FixA family protein [Chloroflexota bacterium]|jgi:electron transfer flavoprotein beta subunit|nr:electron transfer flavoprotein subunit beta/FixA family protein [Chloroflexota bacterium]